MLCSPLLKINLVTHPWYLMADIEGNNIDNKYPCFTACMYVTVYVCMYCVSTAFTLLSNKIRNMLYDINPPGCSLHGILYKFSCIEFKDIKWKNTYLSLNNTKQAEQTLQFKRKKHINTHVLPQTDRIHLIVLVKCVQSIITYLSSHNVW